MNSNMCLLALVLTISLLLWAMGGCTLITTPVSVAGEVAKTGAKVVTYPIRKAVD